jgi:hypothetical protein
MKTTYRTGMVLMCCILGGFAGGLKPARAQQSAPSTGGTETKKAIPPYHTSLPKTPLPPTLDPAQFADPETRNIYRLAAKVKAVLYQQPCFCGCDKEAGHKSLLDCYRDMHATGCDLCKKEAVFAASESAKGKTAAQIRKEIIAGGWKTVDLSIYGGAPEAQ